MTEWRAIDGYEGRYEISDDGRVKALAAPGRGRPNADRVLKIGRNPSGYFHVLLYDGTRTRPISRRVHCLVLEAFVGPRPTGTFGLHADDDLDNNRVENLRWGTQSENTTDSVRNGTHNHASKTHCKWGHPFSGGNLISTERQRACRECARRRNREYAARRGSRRKVRA